MRYCKQCEGPLTILPTLEKERVHFHAKLWRLINNPDLDWEWRNKVDTPPHKNLPPYVFGHVQALVRFLVAGDQGLCTQCTEHIIPPPDSD